MSYAIVVISKKVEDMTAEGQKFLLVEEECVDSSGYIFSADDIPFDVKKFSSKKSAEKYAKKWQPHPWWINPKSFEIVELIPVKTVTNYKIAVDVSSHK